MKRLIGGLIAGMLALVPASAGASDVGTLFEPAIKLTTGVYEEAVAIGDVTGDGLKDIIVGYWSSGDGVMVFPQRPDGTFDTPVTYPGVGSYPLRSIAVADIDRDGRSDVVVAGGSTVDTLLQQSDGTLTPGPTVGVDRASVIVAGDVTGDGVDDLVVASWSGAVHVISPDGVGGLEPTVTYAVALNGWNDLALGDANGDGRTDVVATSGQIDGIVNVHVLAQTAEGTLAPAVRYEYPGTTRSPNGVAVGDVDGDGLAEVVVGFGGNRPNSQLAIFQQDANGGLVPAGIIPTYDIPTGLHIADVSGDGIGDVLVGHSGWNSLSVHRGQIGGIPGAMERYSSFIGGTYEPSGFVVDDLDGDGTLDAVAAGCCGYGIGILRGTVVTGTPPPPPPPPPAVADLAVELSTDPSSGSVRRNKWLSAEVVVTNNGDGPAAGSLRLDHPNQLRPHTVNPSSQCSIDGPAVFCSVDLEPGESATFSVTYRTVARGSGQLVAEAWVTDDPNLDDNTASAPVYVY